MAAYSESMSEDLGILKERIDGFFDGREIPPDGGLNERLGRVSLAKITDGIDLYQVVLAVAGDDEVTNGNQAKAGQEIDMVLGFDERLRISEARVQFVDHEDSWDQKITWGRYSDFVHSVLNFALLELDSSPSLSD